jgi:tetratricopeptide (TPR) repeat protein
MKRALLLLSLLALTFVAGWLWFNRDPSTTLVDASGKALTAGPVQGERVVEEVSLLEEARSLMERQEYARAKQLLLRTLEETDRDGEVCILLCDVTRELKEIDESTDYGLKATELLPESAAAHLAYAKSIGAQLMDTEGGVAAMLSKLGQLDRFKQECERVVELDDTDTAARTMLGFTYLMSPRLMGGDSEKALGYFRAVDTLAPLDGGQLLAFGLAQTDRVEEALELCAARLVEYPEERVFHVTRGGILARAERYDEADRAFEAARPDGGKPDEAYFRSLHGQASTWIQRGVELERAVALLDEFLAGARPETGGMPPPEDAWWRRGQALEALGRRDEANAAYRAGLEAAPDHRASREALEALSAADGE